ncbi:MFS transporter [Kitasatospora sp. NPDC004531]
MDTPHPAPEHSGDTDGPRLRRDRTTRQLYLQLSVFGFVMYGFSPSIPLLAHDRALAAETATLHSTALAVGAVLAGAVTARACRRLGRRSVQSAALLALAGAVVVYCAAPWLWCTLPAAVLLGCSGNIIVNVTAATLADHHGALADAAISEANGIGAGVGMLAPLALGLAALTAATWRLGLLLTVPLALAAWLTGRRTTAGAPPGPAAAEHRGGRFTREFRRAWGVFLLCSGFEMCMSVWASEELRVHGGLSRSAATMGLTLMLLGMVGGRLLGARLAQQGDRRALLTGSLLLAGAGFAVFWTGTGATALVGIALCGLGMSLHFPLAVGSALAAEAGRTDRAMARFALGQGLAAGAGPFLLSALAGGVGIHRAFLASAALLLGALLLARTLTSNRVVPATAVRSA